MKRKHLFCVFSLLTILCFSCTPKNRTLQVNYLREGQLKSESIPLDFINEKGEIVSPYINSVKFGHLDSITYKGNHPDSSELFITFSPLDFKKEIEQYSPEYYAAYVVYNVNKTIEYYNRLFDNKIDFNSQTNCWGKNYRDIEIVFGDMSPFTSPKSYIFAEKSNPNPSLFFHEVGHRAFWFIQDEKGLNVRFKGLSYVHMGLLEYFTVSLNDSPVVGEDALPSKGIRNASWLYGYPAADSLNLEHFFMLIKDSYPKEMNDPQSNMYKYYHISYETYKAAGYFGIIENHRGGMIITSTLWRVRQHLGQAVTDKLVAQTILKLNEYMDHRAEFYTAGKDEKLPSKIDWYDLYYGLIQKDKELNNGKGEEVIKASFKETGFPIAKVKI